MTDIDSYVGFFLSNSMKYLLVITFDVINEGRYCDYIFKDKDSALLASGVRVKRFEAFERIAYRKIRQLQIAASLNDLRIPPGNRLEALSGKRKGQYSIRINDQYRICFVWTPAVPAEVEITDYH